MERIKIDLYISDLLYSYDCVIVPDFGGFVANYVPAQIQTFQHKLKPPRKRITFNQNLKNNDGLLINHVAERRSIKYEEAAALIRSFVDQSIEDLKQGDKISIEKVGVFYMNPDQKIQFRPFEENDYLLDAFGLSSFRALPIKRQSTEEKVERKVKEKLSSKEKIKHKQPAYWAAAASILIILAATFLLNLEYNWVNTSRLEYAILSYSGENTMHYNLSEETFAELSADLDHKGVKFEKGIVPFRSSDGTAMAFYVDNRANNFKTSIDNTKVAKRDLRLKFHVMGGCFSSYQNATALVDKLQDKGYNSELLGRYKNLHAVSYASFGTEEEARRLLAKVRNTENSEAWLLVKPF